MFLPLPTAKTSLACIIIRLRLSQSAGETAKLTGEKKSQRNIFNLCCVHDKKKE